MTSSILFIQCTQENFIDQADIWEGTYETTINSSNKSLDPLQIDATARLTIDGYHVPYTYDAVTSTLTISNTSVNRIKIHHAVLSFYQKGIHKSFSGEISTNGRATSGKIRGKTGR